MNSIFILCLSISDIEFSYVKILAAGSSIEMKDLKESLAPILNSAVIKRREHGSSFDESYVARLSVEQVLLNPPVDELSASICSEVEL